MKVLNKFSVWLLVFLMVPAVSTARTFTHTEHGYTIDIDDSFRMRRDYDVTYFESGERDKIVVIRNRPGLTEEVARDYLEQGYQDQSIAIVAASGSKEKLVDIENGKALLIDVRGIFERKLVKGVAGGYMGDDGQGLVVLVAATDDVWGEFAPEADKIAASAKFIAYGPAPDLRDWYYMLAGSRLTYRGTTDGRSRREYLDLCSDNSFVHKMSFSAMSDSDSGSAMGFSTKTRSGMWDVVDDDGKHRLLLFYNDGNKESAIIEDRGGQIYLDERHYTKLRKNSCR